MNSMLLVALYIGLVFVGFILNTLCSSLFPPLVHSILLCKALKNKILWRGEIHRNKNHPEGSDKYFPVAHEADNVVMRIYFCMCDQVHLSLEDFKSIFYPEFRITDETGLLCIFVTQQQKNLTTTTIIKKKKPLDNKPIRILTLNKIL